MPPTLLSSQQSDLGDDNLVNMIEASESTNTKRTTSWGFYEINEMVGQKKYTIGFEICY